MHVQDWIFRLLFGGIVGTLGQGLRSFSGLKKLYDEASHQGSTFKETFETSRMVTSLFLGFIAGSLAVIAMDDGNLAWEPKRQDVMTLLAAGYAGSDFIEAFIARYLPKSGSREPDAPTGAPAANAGQDDHDVPAVG